jgi:hypothetical protein
VTRTTDREREPLMNEKIETPETLRIPDTTDHGLLLCDAGFPIYKPYYVHEISIVDGTTVPKGYEYSRGWLFVPGPMRPNDRPVQMSVYFCRMSAERVNRHRSR